MSGKGTIHPNNLKLSAGEHNTLERLDFFFGDASRSSAIGEFFQKEAQSFSGFTDTNSPEALSCFALFKKYGELVDSLLTAFCEEDGLKLEEVASSCIEEYNKLEGAPSSYICVPYIIAALEIDAFVDLVYEMKDLNEYEEEEEKEESSVPEETTAPTVEA